MSVWAVAVVRDEADIIEQTVRQMRANVDRVLIADNGSTDGTRQILDQLGVLVVDDDVRGFYQAEKVTRLAQMAREAGAEWVVPFDADELWQTPPGRTIRDVLESQPAEVRAVGAVFWNHVPTTADDPEEPDPIARMRWREMRNGELLRVACRTHPDLVIEDGNHFASYGPHPSNAAWPAIEFAWPQLAVRHYSVRSRDQFVAKVRKVADGLAAAELHPAIASHWRKWAVLDPAGVEAEWLSHVRQNPDRDFTLTEDPA